MKMIPIPAFLLTLFLVACGNPDKDISGADAKAVAPKNVDATAAAALIEKSKDVVILDIRTPEEFAAGHLAGAKNIDFNAPDFEAKLSELDRGATYLMHCQSGGRSGSAMPVFEKLQFENVIHLNTGFLDWAKSGLPVEK